MIDKLVFNEADYHAMREHEAQRDRLLRNVAYEPTDGPSNERWSAVDGLNYEEGDPVGLGATKDDALIDLMQRLGF